jgi:predicted AAA+ superfamily ATPase
MYLRSLEPIIEELLVEFRIVYLTGPRQAGKTTIVRDVASRLHMDYMTLDNQAAFEAANNDPHGFIQSFNTKKLALDEFQYSPGLIPAIKECSDQLDAKQMGKFLLTGSADIFRSAKTQEALPGHMARLELYPLSITELTLQPVNLIDYLVAQNFEESRPAPTSREQLANWIINGGYPEVQSKSARAKSIWFKSYVQGRLFKDFESLYTARGDYHSKLNALISYLAGLSGNLLKYSNVSNDLELDDKLVKTYIQILELMFIVKRLPAYLKNRAKREATRMPKMHFVDTGLACHLLGIKTPDQLLYSQYYGGLLENLMFMECCKHAQWASNDVSLYHFRDKQKNEVDIVLEQADSKVIGIEIKASASVCVGDFKGLRKLAEFTGKNFSYGAVFYSGQHILPFHQGEFKFYALPMGLVGT